MTDQEISPFKALDFMIANAKTLAQADRDLTYLVEFRKSKKALLMIECNEKTESAKESYAYSHPDYIQILKAISEAKEKYIELRWLMTTAQAKIEVWRSLESSARAEGRATQ
jgi:hypothetical protein